MKPHSRIVKAWIRLNIFSRENPPSPISSARISRLNSLTRLQNGHTGHVGGLKEIQYKTLMVNKADLVVYEAVKGMLPKNSLGRSMLTKLKVYRGAEHNHQAQKPEELKLF